MTIDKLFIAVCNDLDRLISIGDEYSMLRASALLRQLILDGFIHTVNKKRIKILFPVCGREYRQSALEFNPTFYSALSGIHESGTLGHTKNLVKLDKFLSETVIVVSGKHLSVRDHAANVLGGVHLGEPKNSENIALSKAHESITAFGLPLNATQLKPIVQVTLDGLAELRSACS